MPKTNITYFLHRHLNLGTTKTPIHLMKTLLPTSSIYTTHLLATKKKIHNPLITERPTKHIDSNVSFFWYCPTSIRSFNVFCFWSVIIHIVRKKIRGFWFHFGCNDCDLKIGNCLVWGLRMVSIWGYRGPFFATPAQTQNIKLFLEGPRQTKPSSLW
jgi:hypothetical protein